MIRPRRVLGNLFSGSRAAAHGSLRFPFSHRRSDPWATARFAVDSPLEESGFELSVPSLKAVLKQDRSPLCNARRFGAGTGTETSKSE